MAKSKTVPVPTTGHASWSCKTHGQLVTTYMPGVTAVACRCGRLAVAS